MRKVLSQCGVIVSFQCRDLQDLESLAPMFAIPCLDYTRYQQPMQLHTGYEILELDELSESTNWNNTDTVGRTITNTVGGAKGIARAISLGLARAIGTSEGLTFGTSEQKLLGESEEETHGISRTIRKVRSKAAGGRTAPAFRTMTAIVSKEPQSPVVQAVHTKQPRRTLKGRMTPFQEEPSVQRPREARELFHPGRTRRSRTTRVIP